MNAPVIHDLDDLHVFHCPGCGFDHLVYRTWAFNGDYVRPTFSPSILVTTPDPSQRCHSYVRNGMIQFLADCHHDLRNQTVPLPAWDDERF